MGRRRCSAHPHGITYGVLGPQESMVSHVFTKSKCLCSSSRPFRQHKTNFLYRAKHLCSSTLRIGLDAKNPTIAHADQNAPRSSYFLVGFYTLSLTCLALILKFGVLEEIRPPNVKVQGLFVLACFVAGIAGGGVAIFFWKGARYLVGSWGGFALALFVQALREGGVVRLVGFRWFLYIGFGTVGFLASAYEKWQYHVLLASTAFVGSSAFVLGVDCYTTAGLKEFYVYNLGFQSLFPTFTSRNMPYPISQTMMIELGLIGAFALMGVAVQLKLLAVLMRKLKEIDDVEKERERSREERAAKRFDTVQKDLDEWEKDHRRGDGTPTLAGDTPGGKDIESGMSTPNAIGMLPTLDLGGGASAADLSAGIVQASPPTIFSDPNSPSTDPELKSKLRLLEEIRKVRQNIDAIRTTSPSSTPTRPPRAARPAASSSAPVADIANTLRIPPDERDWDAYAKDRTLFTPPRGVSDPIGEGVLVAPALGVKRMSVSPAVRDALERRWEVERVVTGAGASERRLSAMTGSDERRLSTNGDRRLSAMTPLDVAAGVNVQAPDDARNDLQSRSSSLDVSASVLPPPAAVPPPVRRSTSTTPSPNSRSPFTVPQTPSDLALLTSRHRTRLHALQEPLTTAEAERRKVEDAKERWGRSLRVEREVMGRKEREGGAGAEDKARDDAKRMRASLSGEEKVLEWQRSSSTSHRLSRHQSQVPHQIQRSPTEDQFGSRRASAVPAQRSPTEDQLQFQPRRMSTVPNPPQPSRSPTLEQFQPRRMSAVPTSPTLSPGMAMATSRRLSAWSLFNSPGTASPPSGSPQPN